MQNKNGERWSPFDPDWYKYAFDKFISTSDMLFNEQDILDQGYTIPDADGSKSSVFRNDSVLNNSFNEKALRETLRDIYLNSSYKLVATNHDGVSFYQWNGTMNDVTFLSNDNRCEIVIPTESFINTNREKFKLSQFYRKWITYEDMMTNWDILKWTCLLFVNQRPYVDYSLRIDDQQTVIRFTYKEFWKKNNYPIYIYKFNTCAQTILRASQNQLFNTWNWKVPVNYLTDTRIANNGKMMAIFTRKINDRVDGIDTIDPMSDNIEFFKVIDGYIDMTSISEANKNLVFSDTKEPINITLFTPKFVHEFPIPLPVDVFYRSYRADFMNVKSNNNGSWYNVKTDEGETNVYTNMDDTDLEEWNDGWKTMIRPLVLSDAYVEEKDPYDVLEEQLNVLKDSMSHASDRIETFHNFILDYTTDEEFLDQCDLLEEAMHGVYLSYNEFLANRRMEKDEDYNNLYDEFTTEMVKVREQKLSYPGFKKRLTSSGSFWVFISPLVSIPQGLVDKYAIIDTLNRINNKTVWEDKLENQLRFKHPIDESDFWMFEYDDVKNVWRPTILNIERHYPDVYLFSHDGELGQNSVYKAFFFYSDEMNITNKSSDIVNPTPSWDEDMEAFEYQYGANYRDIFLEKFYWMGLKTIYSGFLYTDYRWEVIEYIKDNKSYERFNKLFLSTMDPYFKMGLATYLKSSDFEFPFDYAISKLEESIQTKFIGYQRITNFERYLDKTWIPSYFEYVTKILDDWDYSTKLLRRPRSTFDTKRFLPALIDIQQAITDSVTGLNVQLDWILNELKAQPYGLNVEYIKQLKSLSEEIETTIGGILDFTSGLDLDIYSIDDVNYIIDQLKHYNFLVEDIHESFRSIYDDATSKSIYADTRNIAYYIYQSVINGVNDAMQNLINWNNTFSIDAFMKLVNDPEYFGTQNHVDDHSLIGLLNRFTTPWPDNIKELRNSLYVKTVEFYSLFVPIKSYNTAETSNLVNSAKYIQTLLTTLNTEIHDWWTAGSYDEDQEIIDCMNDCLNSISGFINIMNQYVTDRNTFISKCDDTRTYLMRMEGYPISETEQFYVESIDSLLTQLLDSLSHAVSQNDPVVSNFLYNEITSICDKMIAFINHEEDVFNKIIDVTNDNNDFYLVVLKYEDILDAMISYMKTVDREFIPDPENPTYAKVYKATDVELVTGGFMNDVGELVFVPNLGVYQITGIDGDIATATSIENTGVRNTIFKNPTWESNNPYDSITNGDGMGIAIKAVDCEEIKIINDSAVNSYNDRISNIVYLSKRDGVYINPYSNSALSDIVYKINSISDDWYNLLSFYTEYMSEPIVTRTNTLINECNELKTILDTLIDIKSYNDLAGLLNLLETFINTCYTYFEDNGMLTPTFIYFDNRLREVYARAYEFYGNGTSWNDPDETRELLNTIEYEVNLYKRKALENIYEPSLLNLYNEIIEKINTFRNALNRTAEVQTELYDKCQELDDIINDPDAPTPQIDEWYNLRHVSVGNMGSGYSVGDIVELVTDASMMNDQIYIQIDQVDSNGGALKVSPLLDYALPYQLNGSKETISCVGSGSGLIINTLTYNIGLKDNTLFLDPSSDPIHTQSFDKNDMFKFKFENIHDLNITYEVFYAGKQIHDFVLRHECDENPLHPRKMDVIYLNANDIFDLRNSSIYINSENYLVYKLDKVEIIDPGAGYSVGQEIVVDADEVALKLKIAKLLYGPLHKISEIEFVEDNIVFNGLNPASDHAEAVNDSLNNIDDEYNNGYYDQLTQDGITKPATFSYDPNVYTFTSRRFDNIDGGDRNSSFMYSDFEPPAGAEIPDGDPDYHFFLGSRIDENHKWNGIMNIQEPLDPVIAFENRMPPDLPLTGEYQFIDRENICNRELQITADLEVETYADLPKKSEDWSGVSIGNTVIVKHDETNDGHRMLYTVRSFFITGYIAYEVPETIDEEWRSFNINWMETDFYPDLPSLKTQYPDASWDTAETYRDVINEINNKEVEQKVVPQKHLGTYITDLTIDDLSVWNFTTKSWEDLHDDTKWELEVHDDEETRDYGFKLTYIADEEFSYDMKLYLNKIPDTQIRNELLKKNAVFKIQSIVQDEVNTPSLNISVNTGRTLRIRKTFPYEQKESYTITPESKEINFNLAKYIHFRNEVHLEDIILYNKTAGRFENILDENMFEIWFKDDKAKSKGYETQTKIIRCVISEPGDGFTDGQVWCYNEEYGIQVFAEVTSDFLNDGSLLTITPRHCPKPPNEDISLEFRVFQYSSMLDIHEALAIIEFQTQKIEVTGDGYIHNVTNRLAPINDEVKIIPKYDIDESMEYDLLVSKSSKQWTFIRDKWEVFPVFHIDDYQFPADRVYIMSDSGRFPLVNPSTGKPSMYITHTDDGMDVMFLNMYHMYDHFEVHTTPYPMRSVYVQRRVPENGFIDLKGKINKPLNKKYFEFWMNGRLLFDEVTIISPTKLFLHGLKSLRNFEIIEVNRDANEYFSDLYLEVEKNSYGTPYPVWNFDTYLDDALTGDLEDDNYSLSEQEALLSPVWKQVPRDNENYKNYPINQDLEQDILLRVDKYQDMSDVTSLPYQFSVIDLPTIEGVTITGQSLNFNQFGFVPITNQMIVEMLNEEWKDEIASGTAGSHEIVSDEDWYGLAARLYDEYGVLVHTLNEAAYKIIDDNLLKINTKSKLGRIVRNQIIYDLD